VELKPRKKTKEAKRARRVLDLLRVRAALSSGSRVDQREGGNGGGRRREEEKGAESIGGVFGTRDNAVTLSRWTLTFKA
jgi:hypothetical protein